ncbi:hypothetical protein UPYG_G00322920 [Umbra pygmaea]|uniref:Centrosomal protein of 68 kDa n=1 Tax=Umbra pygmaea TaxID=75934 RepID=A0ABD0W5F4_UMBPY
MALGVDRAFPASVSSMESKSCSSARWKSRTLNLVHSGTGANTRHSEDTDLGNGGRCGGRKIVTMAPTSRYMSDRRQYSVRKPLFTTTDQPSILKKSYLPDNPKKERQWDSSYNEDFDFLDKPTERESPGNFNPSRADISPRSGSREELSISMELSDLRTWQSHEDPTLRSPYLDSRSSRRSLSSPPLDVQTFYTPPIPVWTSTLLSPLSPPSIPPSLPSRKTQTELREVAGEGNRSHAGGGVEAYLNVGHSTGFSRGRSNPALHTMSSHQANYWACAIPRSLPPSPDRGSSNWDPDREYQALLDYTYPLRPGRVVGGWDTSGVVSHIQTDPGLQDSGIELDRDCSSNSISGLDISLSGMARTGRAKDRGTLGVGQRSSELRGLSHSKSSDGHLSGRAFSSVDSISPFVESLGSSGGGDGLNHSHQSGTGHYRQRSISSSSSNTFIRTTSILPRPGRIRGGDWDQEFWPLPERLEELHGLSRQVREVTAQLSQPVTVSWDTERGTTSVETQESEEERREQEQNEEEKEEVPRWDTFALQYFDKESVHSVGSFQEGRSSGFRTDPGVPGRGVSRANLREVEAMVDKLSSLTLPEVQTGVQGDLENRQSLLQHIQTFCGNLGELIQWLYTVVDRMEGLAPPTVDIESVKSSLADYKRFQREVNAHQPLTTSVLQTGELLLGCMTSTSPVLKETLSLIERQSRALETHSEHLFSSILSAMDSLTQPAEAEPIQRQDTNEQGPRQGGSEDNSVKAPTQDVLNKDSGLVEA